MGVYKALIDGFFKTLKLAGIFCKSLADNIIFCSATPGSPTTHSPLDSFSSSQTNRNIIRPCCCIRACSEVLPELATPGSEEPSVFAANNSVVRHRSCLFEEGCSTLPEVLPAARFFCLFAPLAFACGRCCSVSLASSSAVVWALFLCRALSFASVGS